MSTKQITLSNCNIDVSRYNTAHLKFLADNKELLPVSGRVDLYLRISAELKRRRELNTGEKLNNILGKLSFPLNE